MARDHHEITEMTRGPFGGAGCGVPLRAQAQRDLGASRRGERGRRPARMRTAREGVGASVQGGRRARTESGGLSEESGKARGGKVERRESGEWRRESGESGKWKGARRERGGGYNHMMSAARSGSQRAIDKLALMEEAAQDMLKLVNDGDQDTPPADTLAPDPPPSPPGG